MIGNLAGDLVKGPLQRHGLHPRVADGVRRHRIVDVLTDRHPGYRQLRQLWPEGQRRIAGIALDLFFDHFLSLHWGRFSAVPRRDFLDAVYRWLLSNPQLVPEPMAGVLPRWVDADWLNVYQSREGLEAVLQRVNQRLRRDVSLMDSLLVLEESQDELQAAFARIFTDVQAVTSGRATAPWLSPSTSPSSDLPSRKPHGAYSRA